MLVSIVIGCAVAALPFALIALSIYRDLKRLDRTRRDSSHRSQPT